MIFTRDGAGMKRFQYPVRAVTAAAVVLLIVDLVAGCGRADAGGPGQWIPPAGPSDSPSPSPAAPTQISMSAVGDVILGNAPNRLPPHGGRDFFSDVEPALAADLQMANLEQPLTDDTGASKCSKASAGKTCFQFRAPPSYAKVLADAGFDLVNIANNHALDFGQAGHKNTEQALTGAGVRYTGPPGMITTVTVQGVRVAVVGFAPYSWANDLNDISEAKALVRQAKKQADLVVVQAHMGAEGRDKTHVRPGTEVFLGERRGDPIAFSHAVIDAGADLVVGSGPHVLRAMEFYKGKLIAYSLGNFAGYHALSYSGVLGVGGVLHVTLTRDGTFVTGSLVPTRMVAPGLPRLDPDNRAISLVAKLTKDDFPKTGAHLEQDGKITPPGSGSAGGA